MFDQARVKRILRGDKAEGERLVSQHYARIYRWLRNLTGSVETAQDLTQQTFTQAWQALGSFRGEASISTWLHRIAYHEYTHWRRAQRPSVALQDAAEIVDPRAVSGLSTVMLRRALDRLPAELREVFLLYHVQEFSVAEVATVLNIPGGTVKSRLFTARRRLRELLDEPDTHSPPSHAKAVIIAAAPHPAAVRGALPTVESIAVTSVIPEGVPHQ